jgi:hypothetical protein
MPGEMMSLRGLIEKALAAITGMGSTYTTPGATIAEAVPPPAPPAQLPAGGPRRARPPRRAMSRPSCALIDETPVMPERFVSVWLPAVA